MFFSTLEEQLDNAMGVFRQVNDKLESLINKASIEQESNELAMSELEKRNSEIRNIQLSARVKSDKIKEILG